MRSSRLAEFGGKGERRENKKYLVIVAWHRGYGTVATKIERNTGVNFKTFGEVRDRVIPWRLKYGV